MPKKHVPSNPSKAHTRSIGLGEAEKRQRKGGQEKELSPLKPWDINSNTLSGVTEFIRKEFWNDDMQRLVGFRWFVFDVLNIMCEHWNKGIYMKLSNVASAVLPVEGRVTLGKRRWLQAEAGWAIGIIDTTFWQSFAQAKPELKEKEKEKEKEKHKETDIKLTFRDFHMLLLLGHLFLLVCPPQSPKSLLCMFARTSTRTKTRRKTRKRRRTKRRKKKRRKTRSPQWVHVLIMIML